MVYSRVESGSVQRGHGIGNLSVNMSVYNIGDARHVLFEQETEMNHGDIDVLSSKDLRDSVNKCKVVI